MKKVFAAVAVFLALLLFFSFRGSDPAKERRKERDRIEKEIILYQDSLKKNLEFNKNDFATFYEDTVSYIHLQNGMDLFFDKNYAVGVFSKIVGEMFYRFIIDGKLFTSPPYRVVSSDSFFIGEDIIYDFDFNEISRIALVMIDINKGVSDSSNLRIDTIKYKIKGKVYKRLPGERIDFKKLQSVPPDIKRRNDSALFKTFFYRFRIGSLERLLKELPND
jgi:hypothetical protein